MLFRTWILRYLTGEVIECQAVPVVSTAIQSLYEGATLLDAELVILHFVHSQASPAVSCCSSPLCWLAMESIYNCVNACNVGTIVA